MGWMDLGVQPFGICTLWCPMGPRSTQCPFAMPASQLLPILLLEGWPFQISGRFAQHSRCPYGWREGSFFAEFSVNIPPFRKEFSTALALAPLHRTQFGNHAGAAGATHSAAECWFGCVPVRGARGRPRRGRQTISLFLLLGLTLTLSFRPTLTVPVVQSRCCRIGFPRVFTHEPSQLPQRMGRPTSDLAHMCLRHLLSNNFAR